MADDDTGATPLASTAALSKFLPDADQRRQVWSDYFTRREREKEAVAKAREESKAREYREMLGERFHVDPATIQIVSKLRSLQGKSPARCARVWYQVQVIANDLGIDADLLNEERDDDPVFDRTTVARRQGVSGGYNGSVSANVKKTRINQDLAERMLNNLRSGLPARHRVGRPSNEERAAQMWAEERYDQEREISRQQNDDIRLSQQQADENLQRLTGIKKLDDGDTPSNESH